MPGRKIVVAGGSGFIGRRLVAALATTGEQVVVLSRAPLATKGVSAPVQEVRAREVAWDASHLGEWASELEGAHAVVNLAGETMAQRWDAAGKARIVDSRVNSAGALLAAIQRAKSPPKRWINASAVGYYGDRGGEDIDESSPPGQGFLPDTCIAWENAVQAAPLPSTERSIVRIGFVLGPSGGLTTLLRLARLGLSGSVGSGRQFISWIHLDDLIGILEWLIDVAGMPPIVNGTAPNPVTNHDFMRAVRAVVGAPVGIPAPAFAVRLIGEAFGPGAEMVLSGARAFPRVALHGRYEFKYPELGEALEAVGVGRPTR